MMIITFRESQISAAEHALKHLEKDAESIKGIAYCDLVKALSSYAVPNATQLSLRQTDHGLQAVTKSKPISTFRFAAMLKQLDTISD